LGEAETQRKHEKKLGEQQSAGHLKQEGGERKPLGTAADESWTKPSEKKNRRTKELWDWGRVTVVIFARNK